MMDRNYGQAVSQVGERLKEANELLGDTTAAMLQGRPREAVDRLTEAKAAIDGALVAAQWATTLPANLLDDSS